MRLQPAWLCLVLSLACTGKREGSGESKASRAVDPPADTHTPPIPVPDAKARLTEQPRSRLLVLAHEPTAAEATLRAIELEPQTLGAALSIPTLPYEHWPDHFRV